MSTAPFLLAAACARSLRKVLERGYQFDVIDAHYFYPAGVAAMLLGRHFGKPVVITARGSDINLIAQHAIPRRLIVWAARRAAAVAAVSQALKRSLEQLGVDAAEDLCVAQWRGRWTRSARSTAMRSARDSASMGRLLLSVGNLVELKGHELAIRSLTVAAGG